MKRNLRKKFFIDRDVQSALMRRIVLQWLLFLAVSLMVLPVWQLLMTGNLSGPFSQVIVNMWTQTAPVFVLLVALIPAFVWDSLTLSNRFAGPMCRLRGAMRRLAAGEDVEPLKFRKGDFWQDVGDDFNAVLERLASAESAKSADSDSETELAAASAGNGECTCERFH